MATVFTIRAKIKQFITNYDRIFAFVCRAIIAYVALYTINYTFGYQKVLLATWVPVVTALVCGFLSMSLGFLVVALYAVVHLVAFSNLVAVAALGLAFVSYGLCAYFQAKHTHNIVLIPITNAMGLTFAMPLWSGLFGGIGELVSVVMGAICSYFIHSVYVNIYTLSSEDITVLTIITAMLAAPMFYAYILANVVTFLMVYYIRISKLPYSWFIAVTMGIVSELLIMFYAYSFLEGSSGFPTLAKGSALIFVVGMIVSFFVQDGNFAQTERVIFEDDEYFYYVTAVPKVRIAQRDRQIKTITEDEEE